MCKINGRMATVNELKEFMSEFIDIHGQNDNQHLLDNKKQLGYLDGYAGDEIKELKAKILWSIYTIWQNKKKELKDNLENDKEKQRKIDLLQYQIKEIEEAKFKIGEEATLEEQRKIIVNSEKIAENLQNANSLIEDGGIDNISMAIRALEKIENIDEKIWDCCNKFKKFVLWITGNIKRYK